jgi:hypothetical protein
VSWLVLFGILQTNRWPLLMPFLSLQKFTRNNINEVLESFRLQLKVLTKAFLLDDDAEMGSLSWNTDQQQQSEKIAQLEQYMTQHRNAFLKLNEKRAEASAEFFTFLNFSGLQSYQEFVESIGRLTQHLGGMSSSVVKETELVGSNQLSSLNAVVLRDFIEHIGPSLRKLASRCKEVIVQMTKIVLPMNWRQQHSAASYKMMCDLEITLQEALEEFDASQKSAMYDLYKCEKFDGTPTDGVFLVYYFVFCMVEFAKELKDGLLASAKEIEKKKAESSWSRWFRFWTRSKGLYSRDDLA